MYFEIASEERVSSLDALFDLVHEKTYGFVNKPYDHEIGHELHDIGENNYVLQPYHHSTGIFRGQTVDWELIPSSYRNKSYENDNKEISEISIKWDFRRDNQDFFEFSKLAEKQNKDFPKSEIERMVIAQHYGIKTPLLDWSRNIFVAIYFALTLKRDQDSKGEPYIYHIPDERVLGSFERQVNALDITRSTLVEPPPIDRRVERQFSVFTYHPHPLQKPKLIPVNKYIIGEDIFFKLWDILAGIGFNSSYYFPDYAGISDRINKGYTI